MLKNDQKNQKCKITGSKLNSLVYQFKLRFKRAMFFNNKLAKRIFLQIRSPDYIYIYIYIRTVEPR